MTAVLLPYPGSVQEQATSDPRARCHQQGPLRTPGVMESLFPGRVVREVSTILSLILDPFAFARDCGEYSGKDQQATEKKTETQAQIHSGTLEREQRTAPQGAQWRGPIFDRQMV